MGKCIYTSCNGWDSGGWGGGVGGQKCCQYRMLFRLVISELRGMRDDYVCHESMGWTPAMYVFPGFYWGIVHACIN